MVSVWHCVPNKTRVEKRLPVKYGRSVVWRQDVAQVAHNWKIRPPVVDATLPPSALLTFLGK